MHPVCLHPNFALWSSLYQDDIGSTVFHACTLSDLLFGVGLLKDWLARGFGHLTKQYIDLMTCNQISKDQALTFLSSNLVLLGVGLIGFS